METAVSGLALMLLSINRLMGLIILAAGIYFYTKLTLEKGNTALVD